MLLTIDIGNTNITLGAFDGEGLMFVSRLNTDRFRTEDQYALEIRQIFHLYGVSSGDFEGAAISSVVPSLSNAIKNAAGKLIGKTPLIVGPGVKNGLDIRIDNPKQLGADLVAGAVGAVAKYPLPCFVVDLGTATKISVINGAGQYLGCTISAGIMISLEALSKQTSQLPSVSLEAPPHVIGTNTVDSMQSGTVLGTAAMIDGLCDRIEAEMGEKAASVVATGGLAEDIVKNCARPVIYDGSLVLHGLYHIYNKNV